MAAAKKLQDQHKAFVIQRIACYESPRDTAAALKEEFGIEITPQGAEAYDPTKRAGKDLAKKWVELFNKIRKDYLDNVEKYVPEANKTVRIGMLANAAKTFKSRNNLGGMANMLEQISKEMGNAYTNKRELTGKDGAPLAVESKTSTLDAGKLSKEALAELLAVMDAQKQN